MKTDELRSPLIRWYVSQTCRPKMTDTITGLPTHRDGLRDAILSHGPACCLLDVDGLIWINDQYGHSEGDRVLVTIARYLVHSADKHGASVFRVGGDEFLLLFPDSADQLSVGEIAAQIVSGVSALGIPYRRTDRPSRTTLEINAAVLCGALPFADRAFSEHGITSEAQHWVAVSLFQEKTRLGRDAGIVVNLFDARDCPWAG